MFKYLLKGVLSAIAVKVLVNYRQLSIRLLKIEAAKAYLHGVRMARLSAIGLMGMGLVIGLVNVGVVLFHAGLFLLLPWSLKTKAVFGLSLGIVYMVGGAAVLHAALDERKWMEKSGASEMLREVTRQARKS